MKRLLSEDEIRSGVARLAQEIGQHYAGQHYAGQPHAGRPLTILGVLTGSLVLVADLIRRLDMPLQVGVIQTRSYRGAATTPGKLEINASMLPDIKDRDVLLVDDIFDTGRTLAALLDQLQTLQPRSLRSAVLLVKKGRQVVSIRPDYVAFDIPDAFVVGYGLDYNDGYRNLPYLARLEEEDLAAQVTAAQSGPAA